MGVRPGQPSLLSPPAPGCGQLGSRACPSLPKLAQVHAAFEPRRRLEGSHRGEVPASPGAGALATSGEGLVFYAAAAGGRRHASLVWWPSLGRLKQSCQVTCSASGQRGRNAHAASAAAGQALLESPGLAGYESGDRVLEDLKVQPAQIDGRETAGPVHVSLPSVFPSRAHIRFAHPRFETPSTTPPPRH